MFEHVGKVLAVYAILIGLSALAVGFILGKLL